MPDPLRRFADRPLAAWQELFQSSPQEEERYLALQAIAALTDRNQAVGWMIRGLQDAESSLRAAAARWLANQKGAGTEAELNAIHARWQELLQDADPDVRFEAARGLFTRAANHQPATTVLLALLNDADTQPVMLAAVLQALSQGSNPGEAPSIAWPHFLQHEQAEVREQAARALGHCGTRSAAQAQELFPLLDDEEPFVREAAAESLGQMGLTTDAILRTLETASTDDDAVVAEAVRAALHRLRSPGAASG